MDSESFKNHLKNKGGLKSNDIEIESKVKDGEIDD